MPVYTYKGINDKGKKVNGVREADSPRALKNLLRGDGIFLTELFEEKAGKGEKKQLAGKDKGGGLLNAEIDIAQYTQRVTVQDITLFTRQLATLTNAGITLLESLNALVEQTQNAKFKRILSQVKDRVNEGASFADALKEHTKVFGPLYINMIRAGETAGALELVLHRLADYTESQMKLRRKVVGALTYPALMVVFAVFVVFLLMVVVIPKISKLFEDMNATLPIQTRILISLSNFVSSYWFIILPVVIFGVVMIRRYINTKEGRQKYDIFVLKVPIFGGLVKMLATTRFSSTMATLLSSGVPMLTAMDIVKTVVGNWVFMDVIEKARENVREGESLATPIQRSEVFDPIVSHMISVGERAGELENMLQHVSDAYETQLEAKITQMTSLLEPLILVGMGVIVGFVVLSIMLPIMQLNNAIRG